MGDWIAFWDSEHSIYVNARHRDVHYRTIAMAGIDVDRMLGIPEGDPIAHHFVPRSPEAGGL